MMALMHREDASRTPATIGSTEVKIVNDNPAGLVNFNRVTEMKQAEAVERGAMAPKHHILRQMGWREGECRYRQPLSGGPGLILATEAESKHNIHRLMAGSD